MALRAEAQLYIYLKRKKKCTYPVGHQELFSGLNLTFISALYT
jgi:hypothetical protein